MGRKNKFDKNLTEHCSLRDNVVPGDTILADRGFDISDSVGFRCSKLELPAFTKGRAQVEQPCNNSQCSYSCRNIYREYQKVILSPR